jgi:hypothetical protein
MRATRDLRRRHLPRVRQRAERSPPIRQTNSQDTWPACGKALTSKTHRAGIAARVGDPAVQQTIDVDLA